MFFFLVEFDYSLDFLPGTLISLKIVGGSFNQNMRNLPGDLQILHFDTFALNVVNLHFVPGKLQHLHLSAGALGNARVSHLPDTLTYLSLTTEEDQAPLPIVALPPNLQTLELHGNYNPPGLGDLLPPTLKSLSLGYSFTESLDSLPPHLRVLETGATFNRRLPALPPTLRYFKRLNNDDIDLSLPKFPPRYPFFLPLPLFILLLLPVHLFNNWIQVVSRTIIEGVRRVTTYLSQTTRSCNLCLLLVWWTSWWTWLSKGIWIFLSFLFYLFPSPLFTSRI